jgi:hypothetical protein
MRLRNRHEADRTEDGRPVDGRGSRLPALAIGGGRVAVGLVFAINPVLSVRMLGVDSATATRLSWLARMTAARDIALGVGTLAGAISGRGSSGWLLAGGVCDIADAAAIGAALKQRQVSLVPAAVVIAGALAAGGAAIATVGRRPQSHLEH